MGRQAVQYHVLSQEEQVARPGVIKDEFLLGRFVPEVSREYLDASGERLIQEYVEGDVCQIGNGFMDRFLQVNFQCDPKATTDQIVEVVEISICKYIMTVVTPRLCDPSEQKGEESEVLPIRCYPKDSPTAEDQIDPDAKAADTLDNEERIKLLHRQHTIIKNLAGSAQFPQFARLFGDFLNADLIFDQIVLERTVPEKRPSEGSSSSNSDDESDDDSGNEL